MASRITEKMRLDWLIAHQGTVMFYQGSWWVSARENQEIGSDHLGVIYTEGPRTAIDAAIKAERGRKER